MKATIPTLAELHGQGRFPFGCLIGYYDLKVVKMAQPQMSGQPTPAS